MYAKNNVRQNQRANVLLGSTTNLLLSLRYSRIAKLPCHLAMFRQVWAAGGGDNRGGGLQHSCAQALVDRLKSQDTADRNSRSIVLDDRQHMEFVARELDQKVEVYRNGGQVGGPAAEVLCPSVSQRRRWEGALAAPRSEASTPW